MIMKNAPLYLIILLSFGIQPIQAQPECSDLDCFIDALKDGKEATYLHQDASFFVSLSSPIEQRWAISKDGIFSMAVSGKEYMHRFLYAVKSDQRYYSSKKWSKYLKIAKNENQLVEVQIDCDCTDRDYFQRQLKVWAMGSYSIKDLERSRCVLQLKNLFDNSISEISRAIEKYELSYELNGMKLGVKRLGLEKDIILKFQHSGTILELDVIATHDQPFKLNSDLSTLEYIKTEDGTSLILNDTVDRQPIFPKIIFGKKPATQKSRLSAKRVKEAPLVQRVSIKTEKRPTFGQYTVLAKGELIFSFPGGSPQRMRDTTFRIGQEQAARNLKKGVSYKVEWGKDPSFSKVMLYYNRQYSTYWSTISIYDLEGNLLSEAGPFTKSGHFINIPKDDFIIEQTYQKEILKSLPFEVEAGIGL